MKQWLWAVVGAAALAGCASAGKGGTDAVVQVNVNNEQRTTSIGFTSQSVDCGRVAHCPTLGAQWRSETPNRATLLVGTRGGTAHIESIEFNARPYAPIRIRALAKEPAGQPGVTAFVVPMDTMERIAFAKGIWVRVTTDKGVIEESMYSGDRSSPASDAFKRFVYEVYKGTDKEITNGLSDMFVDKEYAPNYDK